MNKLRHLWETVSSSLWFVPVLMVTGAILLALLMIEVDGRIGREALLRFPRLFGAGAEGSRGMLEAIAGSMITVAGVTFSITIVALSLASSQYTPRILRNFMRDRVNQSVLGVFLGVFTYCLVVLRTIRGGDEGAFVPSLSVAAAVVLALIGIGFLILFIHHIASSIQASNIIASVAEETNAAVDNLFPQDLGEAADEAVQESNYSLADAARRTVPALSSGYVQSVDEDALLSFAGDRNIIVQMERGIGEFVVEGAPLVSLLTASHSEQNSLDEKTIERLNDAFVIARFRIIEQDAAFGVRQLVDIALKALSPGVNDTTTAVTCIDYLATINARLARRRLPARLRRDAGELRVVARGQTFESLVDESFNQIRESADGNTAVILRMLGALETIGGQTADTQRLNVIARHIALLRSLADRSIEAAYDRSRITDFITHLSLKSDAQTEMRYADNPRSDAK